MYRLARHNAAKSGATGSDEQGPVKRGTPVLALEVSTESWLFTETISSVPGGNIEQGREHSQRKAGISPAQFGVCKRTIRSCVHGISDLTDVLAAHYPQFLQPQFGPRRRVTLAFTIAFWEGCLAFARARHLGKAPERAVISFRKRERRLGGAATGNAANPEGAARRAPSSNRVS
ncbi:hypothetical protein P3T76_011309 [Phytophthora citrophthora]|uniref:Uncharacterized protein n=1 Tax=Phytophthora citrophthora TaxID=4793 RepID=A0AAD9FZ52_9STRA|nr:hypothetical protein P3T76_015615 [Phytophthora citrophthora]KAK1934106.1 hypothetical protein P3T76_011309 [Phytophthora citrophthora]